MDKKNVRYTTCVEDQLAKFIDAMTANKGITASELFRQFAIEALQKEFDSYKRLSAIFNMNQGLSDLLNTREGAKLWSEEE